MQQHDRQLIHSSFESDYRTPSECYGTLDREFHFGLDAAADKESCIQQYGNYLGPDHSNPLWRNALAVDWVQYLFGFSHEVGRTIFLNPPFSKTLVNAYNTGRIKIDGHWVDHEIDREKAKCYDIEEWARKCFNESEAGATIVSIFPFAPQTDWYRQYVMGHAGRGAPNGWRGHAAREERRLPHRISFLQPDGTPTGNAGINSVIVVWKPNHGIVGPWQPHQFYWSYREVT